jgi:ABC-type phosphate transport system substrate-binding protein
MPMLRKSIVAVALIIRVTTLAVSGAIAQNLPALEGSWCHADGKRLTVKGSDVVTPAGKPLRAEYARTFASWVIPDGEPNAGTTVTMMLIGTDRAHTREGAADTPPLEWRRCPAG